MRGKGRGAGKVQDEEQGQEDIRGRPGQPGTLVEKPACLSRKRKGDFPQKRWSAGPRVQEQEFIETTGFDSFNMYVCRPLGCWLEVTPDVQESQALSAVLCVEEGDSEAGVCPLRSPVYKSFSPQ